MTKLHQIDFGIEVKTLPEKVLKEKYLNINNYPKLEYKRKIHKYKNCQYEIYADINKDDTIRDWHAIIYSKNNLNDKKLIKINEISYKFKKDSLIFIDNQLIGNKKSYKTQWYYEQEIKRIIDENYKSKISIELNNLEDDKNIFSYLLDNILMFLN